MPLSPFTAAAISFLLPGSAHVAMGRPLRGLVGALVCLGLFWGGWSIVEDRLWFGELVTASPTGLTSLLRYLPVTMLPESPNFGSTALAGFLRPADDPETLRLLRLPREMEHLGFLMTSASGVLAACWAADAHALARGVQAKVAPGLAAAASWILPGWGHAMLGYRSKGMVLGGATLLMFALGLLASEGHGVDRALYGPWWIGQALCGTGVVFASLVTAPMELGPGFPRFMDLGYVLCTVAGFMNLMVMVNAYTTADGNFRTAGVEAEGVQS